MKSLLLIFAAMFIQATLATSCMDETACRQNISKAIDEAQVNWMNIIESAEKSEESAEELFTKRIVELNDSIATGPVPCRKFLLHEEPTYYIEQGYDLCPPAVRPEEPSEETVATVTYFAETDLAVKDQESRDYYCKHITIYQNYYCEIVTAQLEALEKCDLWGIISYMHKREWDECVKSQ